MQKKSNIKDVCALLDMKSSKFFLIFTTFFLDTDEVNKALDEIHQEMDKVVVTKTELNSALQE